MHQIVLAAAAAIQPVEAPTAQTEMLGINVPDEFQIGNQARNEQLQIVELVQPPETVDNWSKLVTSLMFFNVAQVGLDAFYNQWRSQMRSACPRMTDTLVRGSVDGRSALRGELFCPKAPKTGKPENLTAVLVQGSVNMMMVQIAFAHRIDTSDRILIEHVTGSLKVCDQRMLTSCRARPASGFLATK